MRSKPTIFRTLVRNYIFFSLTVGASVASLLIYFVERTDRLAESGSGTSAETLALFWKTLAETGLLFLVLFGINVFLYSRLTAVKLTNPLGDIVAGIRSIAGGHYHERLRFEAEYELAQIQESFNAMAEKLEKAEKEKRLLEESRRQMLVDISHDLRTPITTIQGYAKALQLGIIADEEKKQRTIKLICDKTYLVAKLIEDVFELSKLEAPDYPVAKEPTDTAEFLREIAVTFYDAFEEKGFVFDTEIPSGEVIAEFNTTLLYRAVSNLLANALKYNPPGTRVLIGLEDHGETVHIEVTDDGIGIPGPLRDKVFNTFVRGNAARTSDGGTGLGLAIARQIAEKHGGSISLDGDQDATRFVLVIPKK
ncbi:HAMP domain-containing histidine kinase [Paenibacillus faecis]|uniref:histidine kinase n=1 Tax=Paenibacillus faecis TaxID=862114 RepID=A0A5D0CPA0_9BACL|nr:HAMP domain-containing sensor histidine kinase [Paenibacillus faecis]TYA11015.1 HAMP domain-containing histidine kinase [Paenibacillus faecis]